MVLRSEQAAAGWVFPLRLTGVTARQPAPNGTIELVDKTGKTVARIPAGFASDAKIDPRSGEGATTYALTTTLVTTSGGGQAIQVGLDEHWLRDPARVFPVTVDPTANLDAATTYVGTNVPEVDHSSEPRSRSARTTVVWCRTLRRIRRGRFCSSRILVWRVRGSRFRR
ncbi:hypothetical protein [Fodinicola feengrottensis]|uniref:hypothetical protein n=1 Tax=Fodinicola feengrottensis TaxID=435914 RepID=UPI0013D2C79F|nr:hypothetical protein [Fodinicola feengrottensis]